jgi:dephospho-CoA kinase
MFVGLTGGTGCGKTTALECFSSLNWKTLDADRICHEIYGDNESGVPETLRKRWGSRIFSSDGSLNRKKISEIVFSESVELRWLNDLLHPEVLRRAKEAIKNSRNKYSIFAVPLLFEAKWEKEFDLTVAVWSDREIQYDRLRGRGWSEKEIEARCNCQFPPERKMELADYALINNGSLDFLFEQCEILNNQIRENYGKDIIRRQGKKAQTSV